MCFFYVTTDAHGILLIIFFIIMIIYWRLGDKFQHNVVSVIPNILARWSDEKNTHAVLKSDKQSI